MAKEGLLVLAYYRKNKARNAKYLPSPLRARVWGREGEKNLD